MNSHLIARSAWGIAILGLGVALTACASLATPGGAPPSGFAADGEVLGQGTVLQRGDAPAQFCLGAVAESYPPQCSGPELVNWDWSKVDGYETADTVRWESYAVQGTWDGERLTVTSSPMLLALYDPMLVVDPFLDPDNAGTATAAELERIQQELSESSDFDVLMSTQQNGYLYVYVVYDDGDIQRFTDEHFGKDVVQIRGALVPLNLEG